ncbi:MAG: hypothetical protein ICV68_14430, partial [Pyrinomonadaceae bacterium]|nr:hypothetical protein [Pyrinomonadaceae bacterium]
HTAAKGDAPGFEWFYLWRLFHGEKETLQAPDKEHAAFAITADAKTLATSTTRTVELRDLPTGQTKVMTLVPPQDASYIYDVAVSPDSKLLAAALASDKMSEVAVKLYDLTSQKELGTFRLKQEGNPVSPFIFSPDGRRLIVGVARSIKLFEVAPFREAGSINTPGVRVYALSPDGKLLATSTPDESLSTFAVKLWDLASGKEVGVVPREGKAASALAFSAQGNILAIGSKDKLQSWTIKSSPYQMYTSVEQAERVTALAYSPDDSTLAVGYNDGAIQLSDRNLNKYATLQGHQSIIGLLSFAPDGRNLFSFSFGEDTSFRSWDLAARAAEDRGHVLSLPDAVQLTADDAATRFAYSPDGQALAYIKSSWRDVVLYDAQTYELLRTLTKSFAEGVNGIAFAPDGRLLATASSDMTAQLWDVASGTAQGAPFGHKDKVRCVAFSPDGKRLATGLADGAINVWDIVTRRVIASRPAVVGEDNDISGIAFSPDGKTLPLRGNRRDELWESTLTKRLW